MRTARSHSVKQTIKQPMTSWFGGLVDLYNSDRAEQPLTKASLFVEVEN
jgi:hypothetical protein